MFNGEKSIPCLLLSVLFGAILVLLFTRLAPRVGLLDHPAGRKQHARPTPLCGGLVFWVALTVLSLSGMLDLGLSRWDWLALHVMAAVGLIDDRLALNARAKALVGVGVALLLSVVHGVALLKLGGGFPLFGLIIPNAIYTTLPILFLWFLFLPQAVNLMDGINGLVIGFSLLVLWFLRVPAILLAPLCVLLLFNYPKARLFLGDCGALLLGTLMAILAVKVKLPHNPSGFFVLFLYPMVDVSLVVLHRLRCGHPLGMGDRNHLHHKMVDLLGGVSWLATIVLLAVAFGLRIVLQFGYGGEALRWLGVIVFLGFAVWLWRGVRSVGSVSAMDRLNQEV